MIGLISDTHGLLRKEVIENLNDCDLIMHTGDIGKIEVIESLKKISQIEYIRGNCDKDKNIAKEDKIIDVYNKRIYLIHDISKIMEYCLKNEDFKSFLKLHDSLFFYVIINDKGVNCGRSIHCRTVLL